MKNEKLIKDIISRIRLTKVDYLCNGRDAIGKGTIRFDIGFDKTHESCKWFTEKIREDIEIRDAIADSIICRLAEPVDCYMEQIKEDREREGGFYADISLELWDDDRSSWVLNTEFPL